MKQFFQQYDLEIAYFCQTKSHKKYEKITSLYYNRWNNRPILLKKVIKNICYTLSILDSTLLTDSNNFLISFLSTPFSSNFPIKLLERKLNRIRILGLFMKCFQNIFKFFSIKTLKMIFWFRPRFPLFVCPHIELVRRTNLKHSELGLKTFRSRVS